MKDQLLQQAIAASQAILEEATNLPKATSPYSRKKKEEFFGRVNNLKIDLKNIRSQLAGLSAVEEIKKLNVLISTLPQPQEKFEIYSHEEWLSYKLWLWKTIASKAPSALLKKQMQRKRWLFFRHANSMQQKEFTQIFTIVENLS